MFLGTVIGELWSTKKHRDLTHHKLLLIDVRKRDRAAYGHDHIIAVDQLDAKVGDTVVVCTGTPARQQLGGLQLPVDAAVLGIVDGAPC